MVVAVALIAVAFFALPLAGLLQKASWASLGDDLTTPVARDALRLSLVCSLSAAALSMLFGLPLAWVLARVEFPGKPVVRGLVLLPLVLPPVVGGVALLAAFSNRGLVNNWLDALFGFRVQLTFTTAGAILAEAGSRRDISGPSPAMIGHGAARTPRPSPSPMRPAAERSMA